MHRFLLGVTSESVRVILLASLDGRNMLLFRVHVYHLCYLFIAQRDVSETSYVIGFSRTRYSQWKILASFTPYFE